MMIFHITKKSTRTKIAFSGFEHESQKVLLLSLILWRLLTLNRPSGASIAPHSRQLYCLASGEASSSGESGSRGQGFGKPSSSQPKKQKLQVSNTADALLRSLGEVSSSSGRDAGSKNLVLGTSDSVAKWRQLDEKVNQYPGHRDFKAIGTRFGYVRPSDPTSFQKKH
ncbi:hypothetical protein WJX79_005560 [Trebouxia sp. C0005]